MDKPGARRKRVMKAFMIDRSVGIVGTMIELGIRHLASSSYIKNGKVVKRCSDRVGEHSYVR